MRSLHTSLYRLVLSGLLIFGIAGLIWAEVPGARAGQVPRRLTAFSPVTGRLDDTIPSNDWQFNGSGGQIISLVAETIGGNLDPVIELYNEQGELIAVNDNATFDEVNARLEAFVLPQSGAYRVQVYREGLDKGASQGDYRLMLLYGFSVVAEGPLMSVIQPEMGSGGRGHVVAELPTLNFYTLLDITMPSTNQPYQVTWHFHASESNTFTWIFQHDSAGHWRLALNNWRNIAIRTETGHAPELLPAAGESAQMSFWFYDRRFEIRVDNELLASIPTLETWTSSGQFTIALEVEDATNANPLLMSLRNLWITTPYYKGDPVIAGAIAATPPGQRLYHYQDAPRDIVAELRALEYIPTESVGLQSAIGDAYIYIGAAGFRAYPLVQRPFQNFALGYTGTIWKGTPETACGVIFRQADAANFATTLFTPSRGIYFLQYEDGLLAAGGLAMFSPAVRPELGTPNHFVVVAREGLGTLFVNGRMAGTIPLQRVAGTVLAHIVLDTDAPGYCQISNLWLWSFDT